MINEMESGQTMDYGFRQRLVDQARIREGQCVLALGCGTATLAIETKRAHPVAAATGLDADLDILRIAKRKIVRPDLRIAFTRGASHGAALPEASFDRVV